MNIDSLNLREKGENLVEMARNAKTPEDWKKISSIPKPSFPFEWGECWKQSFEYRVNDFASEIAFYFNVLGFQLFVLEANHVMFTSPDMGFLLGVSPAGDQAPAVDPASVQFEFMIADILGTVRELETRGVTFEEVSQPWGAESPMHIALFRTPHGVLLKFWGMVESPAGAEPKAVAEAVTEQTSGAEA